MPTKTYRVYHEGMADAKLKMRKKLEDKGATDICFETEHQAMTNLLIVSYKIGDNTEVDMISWKKQTN